MPHPPLLISLIKSPFHNYLSVLDLIFAMLPTRLNKPSLSNFARRTMLSFGLITSISLSSLAYAQGVKLAGNTSHDHSSSTASSHAPIGVMGDHRHNKGEWMLSYRFMTMHMEDNLSGSRSVSPDTIVTTEPNRFFGQPMQPPNLRVVPTEMTTEMHMLGLMYAPSETVTLMAMVNYVEKEMDHLTYMGCMGVACATNTNLVAERGFTTRATGLGDSKLAALVGLMNTDKHQLHANIGVSIPTGSTTKRDTVLTPMSARVEFRLPYPMQLGSGTWDLEPRLTYLGHSEGLSWGAQYKAVIRIGDNDEGYAFGDKHSLSGWGSYQFVDWISASLRLTYTDQNEIDGIDVEIVAPVQTADPNNSGGERWDLGVGFNLAGTDDFSGHRLALEYEWTVDQHVNGVQLEMQDMLTLGYQFAWD